MAWIGAYNAGKNSKEQAQIAECFSHPSYKWPVYDYALCRLKEPSDMPKVGIAPANYEPGENEPMIVIGTGKTGEDKPT
eukprot:CAMPEP_0185727298 /NCGR_PEP_ID=MMETSP1171-20130828/3020_1 /TAXON_ID=374046 /ORGANISM="Helicotheca tamensis, Strain CCMP826" /LENGTH=78 /DNA_ID=CAMNT_0028395827 /DNA_START=45 /DNA_END=277 /DNA_ORIENTATION=-